MWNYVTGQPGGAGSAQTSARRRHRPGKSSRDLGSVSGQEIEQELQGILCRWRIVNPKRRRRYVIGLDRGSLPGATVPAGRINHLPHLAEVEPDQVTCRAAVDDDVASAGVWIRRHSRAAHGAQELSIERPAVQRWRLGRRHRRPRPSLVQHRGERRSRHQHAPTSSTERHGIALVEDRLIHPRMAHRTARRLRGASDDANAVGVDGFREMKRAAVATLEEAARSVELHHRAAVVTVHR